VGPQRLLNPLYRRLGSRYPRAVLLVQLQLGYLVGFVGVAVLALYLDMSAGEFLRLVAVAEVIYVADAIVALRIALRRIEPAVAWLRGERGPDATEAAWQAAAGLPIELLRRRSLYLVAVPIIFGFDVYATWQLTLPWYSALVLLPGSLLVFLYWVVLRFLGTERVVWPILEDIGEDLPDTGQRLTVTIPLRWRLFAALPAINVITGAIVGGLAGGGGGEIAGFAIGMGAAGIALLVSVPLIDLLSESVVTPIADLEDATRRVGAGDLETRVRPYTTDETGHLARSFNEMVAGLAERERIREAFGTYVDREVAEHILREGTDLAGEEVEVTVMFLDVRDFTGFAERLSAPEVVATLNRLFELAVPVIHEHDGHVDKFVGDGLLAVFGAPRRSEDHADRALAAACEIAGRVADDFDELRIGVGLNSGSVVAGNVGGAGRLEFSVIGDAVNVAARVESATRHTGDDILVSEHTRRLLRGDAVPLEERPQVPLKGKREPVALYAPAGGLG
jgi:adenylate cyclase